ncbi:unnamed protein product [Calicophoron daubneyi]|uniref:Uncharacterized protein n=1 Tax=Calicophoron daubneyi TaxID=300641 RepID=A0AAV2TH68_CALDB
MNNLTLVSFLLIVGLACLWAKPAAQGGYYGGESVADADFMRRQAASSSRGDRRGNGRERDYLGGIREEQHYGGNRGRPGRRRYEGEGDTLDERGRSRRGSESERSQSNPARDREGGRGSSRRWERRGHESRKQDDHSKRHLILYLNGMRFELPCVEAALNLDSTKDMNTEGDK